MDLPSGGQRDWLVGWAQRWGAVHCAAFMDPVCCFKTLRCSPASSSCWHDQALDIKEEQTDDVQERTLWNLMPCQFHVTSCHATSHHVMSCHVTSYHVILVIRPPEEPTHVMRCHLMSNHVKFKHVSIHVCGSCCTVSSSWYLACAFFALDAVEAVDDDDDDNDEPEEDAGSMSLL